MNKNELRHMISLADERYIDEIFTDRLNKKKNKFLASFGAAAAVIALVCVIGFISGKINEDADDLVADTTTDSILIDEPVDYSQYFLKENLGIDGIAIDAGWMTCMFEAEYIKQFMPFDTSSYDDGAVSKICFDYKDEAKYYGISLTGPNGISENANRIIGITVGKEGSILSLVPYIDKCTPVERLGVDVYGAEHDANYELYGFPSRSLMFSCGGRDYSIGAINMTYDEIGMIMDSIIKYGIPVENIELSEAFEVKYGDVNATISLAEANTIEPFAGCVPQLESIGDMQLSENVSYFASRDEAHRLVPEYIYYTYYNGKSKDICIQYFTEDSDIEPSEKTLHIGNVTPGIFEHYMEDGNLFCTIEYNAFKVNIWANNCTDDEIYIFKNALVDAINNLDGHIKTLSEANELDAFAGFIPQLDNIGDMTLTSCHYDNYLNGEEEIVIRYNTPEYDDEDAGFMKYPYIQAVFESGGMPAYTSDYVRLEDLKINVVHDLAGLSSIEGCVSYNISVDCGSVMISINAVCTTDEMWTYLSEIAKAYDGSEINYIGEHPLENKEVTLEYANEATAFSGFVPQVESIGEMSVREVLYSEVAVGNKIVGSHLHIEYVPDTFFGYPYIIAEYQLSNNTTGKDIVTIEKLTEELAETSAGFSVDPEGNFYTFSVLCGEFCINVTAECTEETMKEYIRELKKCASKYTALTLEEAAASELTGGCVPMLDKIGDMTLADGYCRIVEYPDGEQLLRIKYINRSFKYQNEDYDYYGKYISVLYAKKTGTITGTTRFDDIEFHDEDRIDLEDSGVFKYRFTFDCGDFYIGVEALCDEHEMGEYFRALKAANADHNIIHS
ncbi:MAG: hypothetical protein J1E40_03845 [Oscillospiraceae bacterium]|nr:hypothetical protein [Oscillospiraceae bacterium]